jgi:putative salt-induced outer membrane protein
MLKFLLIFLFALLSGAAFSQKLPDSLWHGDVAIGGSYSSGINSSRNFNVNVNSSRSSVEDKIHLDAIANYGSSTSDEVTQITARLLRASGRYDFNLNEDVFVFFGTEHETNQNIDLRSNVNSGAGYKMLHSEKSSWDLFAGMGYSSTKLHDQTKIFPLRQKVRQGSTLLIGEESHHKISETTSIRQKLVIYAGQSEVGKRGVWDLSLNTVVIGGWTLNVSANIQYEGKTVPEDPSVSSLVTFGFGYKY